MKRKNATGSATRPPSCIHARLHYMLHAMHFGMDAKLHRSDSNNILVLYVTIINRLLIYYCSSCWESRLKIISKEFLLEKLNMPIGKDFTVQLFVEHNNNFGLEMIVPAKSFCLLFIDIFAESLWSILSVVQSPLEAVIIILLLLYYKQKLYQQGGLSLP